jgi:peptide/nickel transport system ATP-binding protein
MTNAEDPKKTAPPDGGGGTAPDGDLLLEVKGLKKHFPIRGGLLRRVVGQVKAVDGIDFFIRKGETLGLVGESGSGKTTAGRSVIRLHDPTAGDVYFDDPDQGRVNIPDLDSGSLRRVWQNMQMIFQDPFSSLDPRMTVGRIVGEPLVIHRVAGGRQLRDRVAELLTMSGLRPEHASRYPHAFSGGQRQRIGIARALALNPKLLICDEPVSALDVSVQAQILNLLEDLQSRLGLTYLFVAHDLSVVEHISDRVAVMYVGYIVEMAPTAELFYNPKMPYTEALLASIPKPDPRVRERPLRLPGDVPSPANPPSGCYFHPRCQYAQDICKVERPPLRNVGGDHWAACHFSDELTLKGVPRLAETAVLQVPSAQAAISTALEGSSSSD